jgi:alkanesulfonate monooxygenase SsuD/methylene tetrahydromethanopterin reductase-like flavin-dependent oxidoreductase (luciferase family)
VTERVKLGTSILVLPHRHRVLAAKMLATLDHLAGGRVILGAGVGWVNKALGVDTVLIESRYRGLDDMIGIFASFARAIRPRI